MISESLLIKGAGTLAGTILALVFQPPRSTAGFFRRCTFSLISGFLFSPIVIDYLKWTDTTEHEVAAASIAAFISWFIAGVVVSSARKLAGEKPAPEGD
jgi:hypothetical protein